MERNNKWRGLYRRRFYLKTSVSIITPQKPVLYVVCMHACIKYLLCPRLAICGIIPWVLSFSAGIMSFPPLFPVCGALAKSYPSEILAEQKLFPAVHIHICYKSQVQYKISKLKRCEKILSTQIHLVWVSSKVNLSCLVPPWKRKYETLFR